MRYDRNKGSDALTEQLTAANPCLQKALAEREWFLEHHPHLRTYQAEIDRILDKSGNSEGRLAVLGTLMQSKLLEMQKELYRLTEILQQAIKSNSFNPGQSSQREQSPEQP